MYENKDMSFLDDILTDTTYNSIEERVFLSRALPHLLAGNPDKFIQFWRANVVETLMQPVYLLDSYGKILFTIPPIRTFSDDDGTTAPAPSILNDILLASVREDSAMTGRGEVFLKREAEPLLNFRKTEMSAESMKTWISIFQHYGHGDKIHLLGISSDATEQTSGPTGSKSNDTGLAEVETW